MNALRLLEALEAIRDGDGSPTDRLIASGALDPDPDPEYRGWVVVCLNAHGAIDAFGPFLDETGMHDVADLAGRLVPTWVVDLDDGKVEKYGEEDRASSSGRHDGPERRTSSRLRRLLPWGCVEACTGGPHAPTCATRRPRPEPEP